MQEFPLSILRDPEICEQKRLRPHADLKCFASVREALTSHESSLVQSLNGRWFFHYAPDLAHMPKGCEYEDYSFLEWGPIVVPGHLETQSYGQPQRIDQRRPWQGYEKAGRWDVPEKNNAVGTYVTFFNYNPEWKNYYICFEGLTAAAAIFLNGNYVGYIAGSFTPVDFDISAFIREGQNRLVVRLFSYSSWSLLEENRRWHLSGIFRSVYLYTKPAVHIEDLNVNATLEADCITPVLKGVVRLSNEGVLLLRLSDTFGHVVTSSVMAKGNEDTPFSLDVSSLDILPWSAETPNLYDLVCSVVDIHEVDCEATVLRIGFRRFEQKDGVLLLNGKRLILKGVNRQEWSPTGGYCVSDDEIRQDLLTLKRNNINALCTGNYPSVGTFYDYCDELGFYVISGALPIVDDVQERETIPEKLHKAVAMHAQSMVERDKNHPSILLWSTNREGIPEVDAIFKANTARSVQYTDLLCAFKPREAEEDIFCQELCAVAKAEEKAERKAEKSSRKNNKLKRCYVKDLLDRMDQMEPVDQDFSLAKNRKAELERLAQAKALSITKEKLEDLEVRDLASVPLAQEKPKTPPLAQTSAAPEQKTKGSKVSHKDKAYATREAKAVLAEKVAESLVNAKAQQPAQKKLQNEPTADDFDLSDAPSPFSNSHPLDAFDTENDDGLADDLSDMAEAFVGMDDSFFGETYNLDAAPEIDFDAPEPEMGHKTCLFWACARTPCLNDKTLFQLMQESYSGQRRFQGGFIREFRSQAFYVKNSFGQYYYSGGSDYDKVTSCGIAFSDGAETASMSEVRHCFSNYTLSITKEGVTITSHALFSDSSDVMLHIRLLLNGSELSGYVTECSVRPGQTVTVPIRMALLDESIAVGEVEEDAEYVLQAALELKDDMPWAHAGTEVAHGEAVLHTPEHYVLLSRTCDNLELFKSEHFYGVVGSDFSLLFSLDQGSLVSYKIRDLEFLKGRLSPFFWHAPTDYEKSIDWPHEFAIWHSAGDFAQCVGHDAVKAKKWIHISFKLQLALLPQVSMMWVNYYIYDSGQIRIEVTVPPDLKELVAKPLFGMRFPLRGRFRGLDYYGRGPQPNTADRKRGCKLALYENSSTYEEFELYLRPQDCGTHCDTRYFRLKDEEGHSMLISCLDQPFTFSALPWSSSQLEEAQHPFELSDATEKTYVRLSPCLTKGQSYFKFVMQALW